MTEQRVQRRLAAILAADVVGYSAMMERAEEATYVGIGRLRRELIEPALLRFQGRLIKTTGDGILAEFASPLAAVKCAADIQDHLASTNTSIRLRIGVNLGDMIVDDQGDVYGEGINVAARLEGLADPGGILISAKVHAEIDGKVDLYFEDRGEQQLKNISKPVQAYAAVAGKSNAFVPTSASSQLLALPDKPSIVVLPFQNMSGDPEQEYFADGMVEEITTALSRSRWLFVIARNSAFTYKGKAVDIGRIGRELGVRYVLEGSVRKSSDRIRITGQLIEVVTRAHIWADRFDGRLDDIFDVQDRIASGVIGAILPTIEKAEIALARQKPTHSLSAYDHYLRGLASLYEFTREGHLLALPFFVRAAELDASFALAYAAQAGWFITGKAFGWIGGTDTEVLRAEQVARDALRLGSDDPKVLAHAGQALAFVLLRVEEGAEILSRAVELDPNLAIARLWLGGAKTAQGKFEEAIAQFGLALRLSPLDPRTFLAYHGLAYAHFLAGRYQNALEWAATGVRRWPQFMQLHRQMMAAYAMLGRLEEAAQSRETVLQLSPTMTITEFKRTSMLTGRELESVVTAWRRAGMPE